MTCAPMAPPPTVPMVLPSRSQLFTAARGTSHCIGRRILQTVVEFIIDTPPRRTGTGSKRQAGFASRRFLGPTPPNASISSSLPYEYCVVRSRCGHDVRLAPRHPHTPSPSLNSIISDFGCQIINPRQKSPTLENCQSHI